MHGIIDHRKDASLDMLPKMLMNIAGGGIIHSNIDPIQDILPQLASGPAGMIIMSSPPKKSKRVIKTPNGIAVIESMKSKNMSLGGGACSGIGTNPIGVMGDHFPMSNPLDAILSLLYAHGQKDQIGHGTVKNLIEHKARDVAGDEIVEDVLDFIKALKNGTKEFVASEEGKKITVTVEDYLDAAEKIDDISKEGVDLDKQSVIDVSEIIGDRPGLNDLKKKAYRQAKATHTSLWKLATSINALWPDDNSAREMLSILESHVSKCGMLTVASREVQAALVDKVADIYKDRHDLDGENGGAVEFAEKMVYNTDLPEEDPGVMVVNGHPIDMSKLLNMTYEEGKKALTPSVADLIFDKGNIDPDKFREFVENILDNQDDDIAREEVSERIIEPLLTAFEVIEFDDVSGTKKSIGEKIEKETGADLDEAYDLNKESSFIVKKSNLPYVIMGTMAESQKGVGDPDIALRTSMDNLEKDARYYGEYKEDKQKRARFEAILDEFLPEEDKLKEIGIAKGDFE